jgi:transposase
MARAYSLDLRERVVAAVRSGQSCRRVAVTFGLGAATVVKAVSQHGRGGGQAQGTAS